MNNMERNTPRIMTGDEFESVNVREIIAKYIFHWPVFLIGVFVCFFAAFIYLRYAQPVYSVSSTLLIKDEKKSGLSGGDLLNELDLFGTSKVVDNEIAILKSKTLMRKVVDRLNLSVVFQAEGHIKNSNLYSSKPVEIQIVQMDSTWYGQKFDISFPGSGKYQLKHTESGHKIVGDLNKLERTDFGVYKIIRNNKIKLPKSGLTMIFSNPHAVADNHLSNLVVELSSKQSTVLELTYESTVPLLGQDILNTLIQVYNEEALMDKNKTTQSTIKFIDERLKLITGELTEVEMDVETFKSSRGLTDISGDANLYLESVKNNDAKLNEIELQLSVIKDINRYVNSYSQREKLPSTLGINDPVLLSQINQLSELQLRRDQLLATTTENNPLVAPISKQIETTRAVIRESVSNIMKSLEISKAGLEGNNAEFKGSIKKIPGQERQLISIKRQQTIKESLYLYLLQKKEEAALSYASAVADSRIVDAAYFSSIPVKPKRQIIYLAAFIFGILLPAGYLYGKDILNNKVENVMDLGKLTSAPILGQVSYTADSGTIVVQSNSRKAISEQFRSIRTNMQFLGGKQMDGMGKVTLLTSSMSGEGKSFVASNISAALALSGKKTVLLELDLRKPKISTYLGLANDIGISNYLIGKASIDQIIKPTSIDPNFFVVSSGPIPPNPSELLIQSELERLFEYLQKNFDEIIVDSPPIGLVTDAQVISRVANASIYLVREKVTLKNQIQELEHIYKSGRLPNVNVILNGVKSNNKYGYNYGYGYYADDFDQKQNIKTLLNNLFKRF